MRSRLLGATALFALFALVAGGAAASADGPEPAPEMVDRILAVVNERPVLLSTVRALEAVQGLDTGAALEATIDEWLMFQEAARLPQAQVTVDDEERALESLRGRQPDLEARVAAPELRRVLRRQLTILKYIEFRFRPQVRVSDDDLEAAWNVGYQGEPRGPAFEEASPALRERLEREELDRRIETWVSDLRERAAVRYVDGPGSPPRPDAAGP